MRVATRRGAEGVEVIFTARIKSLKNKSPAQAKLERGTLVSQIDLEAQRGLDLNEPR